VFPRLVDPLPTCLIPRLEFPLPRGVSISSLPFSRLVMTFPVATKPTLPFVQVPSIGVLWSFCLISAIGLRSFWSPPPLPPFSPPTEIQLCPLPPFRSAFSASPPFLVDPPSIFFFPEFPPLATTYLAPTKCNGDPNRLVFTGINLVQFLYLLRPTPYGSPRFPS